MGNLKVASPAPSGESCSSSPTLEGAIDTIMTADKAKIPELLASTVLLAKSYSKREVVDQLSRLHKRMSHMDFRKVASTFGIVLPADYEFPVCDACVVGKAADHPHHEGAHLRATRICQGLHVDFIVRSL